MPLAQNIAVILRNITISRKYVSPPRDETLLVRRNIQVYKRAHAKVSESSGNFQDLYDVFSKPPNVFFIIIISCVFWYIMLSNAIIF